MRFVILAFLAVLTLARGAAAAVVTYGLDLSVPGEFQIFASASSDDNFGLAAYGVSLTAETSAMITSFEQVSPSVVIATDSNSQLGSAGFTLLRTSYTMADGAMSFMASQDAINPTPHLIRGFGQTTSSFSNLGLSALSPATQGTWDGSLLISRGTYAGDASKFHIDTRNLDLFANVFTGQSGGQNIQATVQVRGANGYEYTPLPAPVISPTIDPPPVISPPIITPPPDVAPPNPAPPVIPDPVASPIVPPRYSDGTRPVVTYNVDLSVPGEFRIFASTTAEDNFGLAFYSLPFTPSTTSMITSVEHTSPAANLATDANSDSGSAGFTVLRSEYTSASGGLGICASQDIFSESAHLIYGLGQTSGGFSELGLQTQGASNTTWGESLLIAQGTYSGDAADFLVDTSSVDLVANVFSTLTGSENLIADVHVFGTNGFSYVPQAAPPVVETPPVINPPPSEPDYVGPIDPAPPVIEPPIVEPPAVEPPIAEPPGYEPPVAEVPPVAEPPADEPEIEVPPMYTVPGDGQRAEGIVELPVEFPGIIIPGIITLPEHGLYDWILNPIYITDVAGVVIPWRQGDFEASLNTDPVFFRHNEIPVNEDGSHMHFTTSGGTIAAFNGGINNWLSYYANAGSGSADLGVPEPATGVLAALASSLFLAGARRRRS